MALLQQRNVLDSSVVLADAYMRIKNLQSNNALNAKSILFSLEVFANEQDRLDGKSPVQVLHFHMDENKVAIDFSVNPFYEAYTYLKSLPEFSSAVDA